MPLHSAVAEVVGKARSSASVADRVAYSRDLWPRHHVSVREGNVRRNEPAAVCWPETTEEVARLVELSRREGAILVPFGAGSGVCGGVLPDDRTVVVDLKRMADWTLNRDAPLVDAGPGALGITLEEDLQRMGHTIGHFPSSILCSTVGGWIAARGAGQCSGRYGKIEDMVAGLECVLGTGDVVTLKRRFDGPDLIPLMVGSEGTLGFVTRAKLRAHPNPDARAFGAFGFDDLATGWEALRQAFQAGLRPAVTRLYDPVDSYFLKQKSARSGEGGGKKRRPKRSDLQRRVRGALQSVGRELLARAPDLLNDAIHVADEHLFDGCVLVFVFDSSVAEESQEDLARAATLCERLKAKSLGEAPARHWFAHRYAVSYRQSAVFRGGAFSDTMEVSSTWSRLPALYDEVRRALAEHVLVMAHLSHAYPDGCSIYFTFVGAGKDEADTLGVYDRAWKDALAAATAAGGTVSHHHGVGRSKGEGVLRELGAGAAVLRRVMRALDPSEIMNPGAVIPRESEGDSPASVRHAPVPEGVTIDDESLLATFPGSLRLGDAEKELRGRGLTLSLEGEADRSLTVSEFVAAGARRSWSLWADPVSQACTGLVGRVGEGSVPIASVPRRAVGPDLRSLFVGAGGAVGDVVSATLNVLPDNAPPCRPLPFDWEQNPAMNTSERAAWDAIVHGVTGRP